MPNIVYEVVEHDGGWAYKSGEAFSERFATHDEAREAADAAAARHQLRGETGVISFQDPDGEVHVEVASGEDRPAATVADHTVEHLVAEEEEPRK